MMRTLCKREIETFRDQGFLIVRKVFGADELARLNTGYDYILQLAARTDLPQDVLQGQNGEVHIHFQAPQPVRGSSALPYLRKVQWPALIHPAFEEIRTSPKFPALLEPLIGTSLKQYINQINFKMPGGEISFPWHQDVRPTSTFRDQINNYVQTIIAVDEATVANGCLHIVPESHKRGDLGVKRYAQGAIEDQIDTSTAIPCEAAPGDLILFTSYTVHGSVANSTNRPRRSYINGFVRSSSCTVGKWAFRTGEPLAATTSRDYRSIRAPHP